MRCPQGSQLSLPKTLEIYKFSNIYNYLSPTCGALRARNYLSPRPSCTTCGALRARNYLSPRPSQLSYNMRCPQGSQLSLPKTLYNFPCPQGSQASNVPETNFPFQLFLQLSVPPGLASHQSPRDKLSLFKFSSNSPC